MFHCIFKNIGNCDIYISLITNVLFLGTIQIQKRQQLVKKIHEDELNDMKDYLSQCQQEQESLIEYKVCTSNEFLKLCYPIIIALFRYQYSAD